MTAGTEDPTPYPELNGVLLELVQSMGAILDGDMIAVALQGSFAVGGFDMHSDVDFIVAIREELSDDQVATLQIMHGCIYDLDCEWAKHLEGSYFPEALLRDYSQRGRDLWYLDHGSRSLERSDHCNSVVVRWTLRDHGVPLYGPHPATLIDPIPVEVLRQDILAVMHGWGQEILNEPERYRNRFYQGFVVLNYCRMLHDYLTGDTSSKRASAEWAKANLDPAWRGLIDRTWACRPDPAVSVRQRPDPDDFTSTLDFVRYVIALSKDPEFGSRET
jgi:hypothetical protein